MQLSKFMIKWFNKFVDSGFSLYVANEHYVLLHHSVLNIKLNLLKMQSLTNFLIKKKNAIFYVFTKLTVNKLQEVID